MNDNDPLPILLLTIKEGQKSARCLGVLIQKDGEYFAAPDEKMTPNGIALPERIKLRRELLVKLESEFLDYPLYAYRGDIELP